MSEENEKLLSFPWSSDVVYAGGGVRGPKRSHGHITINVDGGLSICPDDDYYGGEIDAIDAIQIARAILARTSPATETEIDECADCEASTAGPGTHECKVVSP